MKFGFRHLCLLVSHSFPLTLCWACIAHAAIRSEPFGHTKDGRAVEVYVLTNPRRAEVRILTYGGIIQALKVPDRRGKIDDVVLGFDKLDDYIQSNPYFGTITGRYANRIAKGRFTLEGADYQLAINNGKNHLHGGIYGFDKQIWTARILKKGDAPSLELAYLSKDGEEGYPGNLSMKVVYSLKTDNSLHIDTTATTDRATVVNIANHSYFNLSGGASSDILGHELQISADRMTPIDADSIPTGTFLSVKGTPFDFTSMTPIGARIDLNTNEQIAYGKGYDHNFVFSRWDKTLRLQAKVYEPKSGRMLEVLTTEPGVQLYTGNFLDGTLRGKGGKVYPRHGGFCLETQHFPDSPNRAEFPSVVLKKGETYKTTTIYRFSTPRFKKPPKPSNSQ